MSLSSLLLGPCQIITSSKPSNGSCHYGTISDIIWCYIGAMQTTITFCAEISWWHVKFSIHGRYLTTMMTLKSEMELDMEVRPTMVDKKREKEQWFVKQGIDNENRKCFHKLNVLKFNTFSIGLGKPARNSSHYSFFSKFNLFIYI